VTVRMRCVLGVMTGQTPVGRIYSGGRFRDAFAT
jgi:hypothetical protein